MEAHVKDKDQWVDCQRQQHDYRRSEEPVRKESLLTIAGGISDSMSHFKLRISDCGLRIEKLQIYPEISNPKSHLLWFHRSSICSISRFAAPSASRGE